MSILVKIGQTCETMTNGRVKPDRLARRHRQGMVCFCCANWEIVSQIILSDVMRRNSPDGAPFERPTVQTAAVLGPDPLSIAALLNR
jgi:hypothetical protein